MGEILVFFELNQLLLISCYIVPSAIYVAHICPKPSFYGTHLRRREQDFISFFFHLLFFLCTSSPLTRRILEEGDRSFS